MNHNFKSDPFLHSLEHVAKRVAIFLATCTIEEPLTVSHVKIQFGVTEFNIDYALDMLTQRNVLSLEHTGRFAGSRPIIYIHLHPKFLSMKDQLDIDATSCTVSFATAPHITSLSIESTATLKAITEVDSPKGVNASKILKQLKNSVFAVGAESMDRALLDLDARYCIKTVEVTMGKRYFLHPQLKKASLCDEEQSEEKEEVPSKEVSVITPTEEMLKEPRQKRSNHPQLVHLSADAQYLLERAERYKSYIRRNKSITLSMLIGGSIMPKEDALAGLKELRENGLINSTLQRNDSSSTKVQTVFSLDVLDLIKLLQIARGITKRLKSEIKKEEGLQKSDNAQRRLRLDSLS
ncbi:hypothetical protein [Deinococcus marmoris]|uniref:hypothetical protein n=1 Tax=Deinococcus marmoris TaxID=249408 RepID=UPI0012DF26E9|nr:hypothetical protein [Deinococcus marmoris]